MQGPPHRGENYSTLLPNRGRLYWPSPPNQPPPPEYSRCWLMMVYSGESALKKGSRVFNSKFVRYWWEGRGWGTSIYYYYHYYYFCSSKIYKIQINLTSLNIRKIKPSLGHTLLFAGSRRDINCDIFNSACLKDKPSRTRPRDQWNIRAARRSAPRENSASAWHLSAAI